MGPATGFFGVFGFFGFLGDFLGIVPRELIHHSTSTTISRLVGFIMIFVVFFPV